ncbi:hypothetical protein [Sporosarcina sp. FSL K6-2383]|uniref:hypothetical protein n=1 Tax=Sporosarcina sp. FSL K6-2383 TaxID=2921556 RepID=UPI00315AB2F1
MCHKADDLSHAGYAIATGSANAYIATLNPALSAYQEGVSLRLKINVANTGAATVNVNELGAKTIKKQNGNALTAGTLKVGLIYTLVYDGVSFLQQGEGGEYGNATAPQVLAPNTIGTDNGVIPGTMPNRGAVNQSLTSQGQSYTIPQGYHSGSGKVTATYPDNGKVAEVNVPSNAIVYYPHPWTGYYPAPGNGYKGYTFTAVMMSKHSPVGAAYSTVRVTEPTFSALSVNQQNKFEVKLKDDNIELRCIDGDFGTFYLTMTRRTNV